MCEALGADDFADVLDGFFFGGFGHFDDGVEGYVAHGGAVSAAFLGAIDFALEASDLAVDYVGYGVDGGEEVDAAFLSAQGVAAYLEGHLGVDLFSGGA